MTRFRIALTGFLCGVLGTSILHAGDFARYRGLQFGMNLTAAATQAGTPVTEARVVHQRPALIQEMDWQPRPTVLPDPIKLDPVKADTVKAEDPVRDGVLSFFNGELFRIIVTYDRYKIEGMSAEDMIDGISAKYGIATRPNTTGIAYHSNYGEVAPVIARWGDSEYSYDLVRTGDRSSFSLVLYSKRLDALAQTASVEAVRLDAQEAPQRELEKQKKRDEDEHLIFEKARSLNKLNFRP